MATTPRGLLRPSRNRRSAVFDLSVKGWLGSDAYLAGWFDPDLITLASGSTITAAGSSEGLTQSSGAATVIAAGGSEGLSQSSASATVIAAGASLGRAQGAAARVLAYVGASNGITQSAGAVGSAASSTEAGGSAGLSQSSAATVLAVRGGSEGLTQSAGKPIVVSSGASQGLTQSSGLAVTVAVVVAAGASYSVAQVAGTVFTATPVTTVPEGGGVFRPPGRVYVLPSREDTRDQEISFKREPFSHPKLREVKRAKETGGDLKALRDRLLELGRALERNKQAVKDRIRAEQAKETSPELMAILQLLIDEYELTLYNQNAARLLIILADDR